MGSYVNSHFINGLAFLLTYTDDGDDIIGVVLQFPTTVNADK